MSGLRRLEFPGSYLPTGMRPGSSGARLDTSSLGPLPSLPSIDGQAVCEPH